MLVVTCQTSSYEISTLAVNAPSTGAEPGVRAVSEPNRTRSIGSTPHKRSFSLDGTILLVTRNRRCRTPGTARHDHGLQMRTIARSTTDLRTRTLTPSFLVRGRARSSFKATYAFETNGRAASGLNADFSADAVCSHGGADRARPEPGSTTRTLGLSPGMIWNGQSHRLSGCSGSVPSHAGDPTLRARHEPSAPQRRGMPSIRWPCGSAAHSVYLIDFEAMKVTQVFHSDERSHPERPGQSLE